MLNFITDYRFMKFGREHRENEILFILLSLKNKALTYHMS
jgi:hypothetical protein